MIRLPTGAALLVPALLLLAPAARAAEAAHQVNLAAQPLAEALQTLGREEGVDILFPAASVRGKMAPAVSGRLTTSQAAAALLAGSGLQIVQGQDGALLIHAARPRPTHAAMTSPSADTAETMTVIGHAVRISPSNMPLDVIQPTSRVDHDFIANNIIPLASYDDIIKFQPSVWSQNPNGPGIGKAETLSLRGFQDGQYNVTFDGIPFGDSSDLHHTSSAMFIAHDLEDAEVDRGPGTASTSGNATFGGTVGFRSKDPSHEYGADLYGTYGSFDTRAGGVEFDSGDTVFGRGFIDMQHEETDGYLTGSAERRTNFMFKDVKDIGDNTTLTIASSYNIEKQATTQGATLAEYAKFGDNYGLCNNPALQCYAGYQPSTYTSDFDYGEIKTNISHWLHLSEQIYTDGFSHDYTESTDASDDVLADNGVTFYNAAGKKVATDAADVPGKTTIADFRAFGSLTRVSVDVPYATLLAGFWVEYNKDDRWSYSADLSQNGVPVDGKTGNPYSYDEADSSTTYQPYAEADIRPLPGMVIKPGLRYSAFVRDYDASINKGTKTPLDESLTYSGFQPSIAINQQITRNWSAYAQVARGFLAPPVDVFQVADVSTNLKPETTWNYQVGTVARGKRWQVSLDGYYIDFSNYLATAEVDVPGYGDEASYVNSNGAIYKGIELEGQYALGLGFSLYGNYSINDATYKGTSVTVAESPSALAAFGLLYDQHKGPYFSLIGKFIGHRFGLDNTTNAAGNLVFVDQYPLKSSATADLAFGWHFHQVGKWTRDITPSIKIANLFNNRGVIDYAGNQSAASAGYPDGAPLYWRNAGISVFFNLAITVP